MKYIFDFFSLQQYKNNSIILSILSMYSIPTIKYEFQNNYYTQLCFYLISLMPKQNLFFQ